MVIIIGENFFDGLQVVFGSMLVWSEVECALCGRLTKYWNRDWIDTLVFPVELIIWRLPV